MNTELIIGMDGFIGRNLNQHLPNALLTTRNSQLVASPRIHYFDLLKQGSLPDADIVYICAGVNGAKTVALSVDISIKTNIFGTMYIADYYRNKSFVVWISSMVIDWSVEKYAEYKRITEIGLNLMPHVGIVRAGRVLQSNVDDLCRLMIDIGRNQRRGIFPWNEDEKPYAH